MKGTSRDDGAAASGKASMAKRESRYIHQFRCHVDGEKENLDMATDPSLWSVMMLVWASAGET